MACGKLEIDILNTIWTLTAECESILNRSSNSKLQVGLTLSITTVSPSSNKLCWSIFLDFRIVLQ